MLQDQKKKKQRTHQKTVERIKKQIMNQDIGNIRVSYSYLEKTGARGITKNNRLFFLFHKDKIGYINQIPKDQLLPFETQTALPKQLKAEIKLENILKVKNQKQMMIIQFKKGDKNQSWEFKAASQDLAKNWSKIVKSNARQLKQDKNNPPRSIQVDRKTGQQKKQAGKSEGISQFQGSDSNQTINKKLQQKSEKKAENVQVATNNDKKPVQSPTKIMQAQNRPASQKPQNEQQKLVESKLIDESKPIKNPYSQQSPTKQADKQKQPQQIPSFGPPRPSQIQRPQVSLFVGGISVQNEKDQTQLKNKMQSFENITSKAKQEYQRKKQEQKRIQEESKNENQINPSILGKNILSIFTDTKLQIQKMQRQWGYQFAKSLNQFDIIEKFKFYVQAVTRKIVDQLGLEEKKRYYQPQMASSTELRYEINGVLFNVFLIQLKELNSSGPSYIEKGTILSNAAEKMASHEFKNYEYILRLTQNKGKIRVPLSMLTNYKGFTVFAKVLVPSSQTYQNMDLLEKQLQILEAQSRINNSVFQDPQPDSVKIVALQNKAYQKLARAENYTKKFDLCYIEDLRYYLPHDFNNFSKDKPYQRLRWQLIQDDNCQDKILHGEDMCAISKRLKLPQNLRDGINQLTQIGKTIPSRIDALINILQSTDEYFTNSQQLSALMHRSGINIRYLGQMLQKSKQSWLKQLILSQICARSAKKYLFFDLQDCTLNLNQSSIQSIHKFQQRQLIKFLNKMLGNGKQTQVFWQQLNRQSQADYKVSINREEISQQFLLQAIQYHCGFKLKELDYGEGVVEKEKSLGLNRAGSKLLNMPSISPTKPPKNNIQLFTSNSPFQSSNFACFQTKSKIYNFSFTQLYSSIQTLISELTPQSYESLALLLNLQRIQKLPSHFYLSPILSNLSLYLADWISPKQMPSLYDPYYQEIVLGQILPSKLLYDLKIAEIKWALKEGNQGKAEDIKSWVVGHVCKWLGEWSPVLTELYQLFANYYTTRKDQEKKSINYCKSVLKNQQKLLGPNHPKLADSYYLLSTTYLTFNKKLDSINSLKKSKQIILKSNNEESQAYGQILLKMSQLYLNINQIQLSIQHGLLSINILYSCQNSESLVKAVEVVCRGYEILENWELYGKVVEGVGIGLVGRWREDVQLLERIVKVCILPGFKAIAESNTAIADKLLKIISQLPQTTRSPAIPYNFLLLRIQDQSFPQQFLASLSNIDEILEQIQANGMLARWKGFENLSNKTLLNKVGVSMENKGFNFIATLEAVNIFIGGGYIEGLLMDR